MRKSMLTFTTLLMCLFSANLYAQLGTGWTQQDIWDPNAYVQLWDGDHFSGDRVNQNTSYSNSATYNYVASTKTETFKCINPGYRAEIRVNDEYTTGSRQMEGYVTIKSAVKHFIMQIWGSGASGTAITFTLRVYGDGRLCPNEGGVMKPAIVTNCFDRRMKINIVHMQEDVYSGGIIRVFIDNEWKGDYEDIFTNITNTDGNYFKWGAYGDQGDNAEVVWEDVKLFAGGSLPSKVIQNVPTAPDGLSATSLSASQISLTWNDNASNESNIVLERSLSSSFTSPTVYTLNANTESYTDNDLDASTTYYYRVKATNTAGSSAYSSTASATTASDQQTIPGAINDRTTGTGDGQFEYVGTWSVITGQAGNYNSDFTQSSTTGSYVNVRFTGTKIALYGKKKPDSGQATCTIDVANAATADFYAAVETKMSLLWESPQLSYGSHTLKVEIAGTKNASSTGYLCRLDYVVVSSLPGAPSNLAASVPSSSQVNLTWSDNANNETNIVLERSLSSTFSSPTAYTLSANTTSYSNTGLTSNTTYYYRAKSTNSEGSSAYSATVTATTLDADTIISGAINDRTTGTGVGQFEYVGTWEVITPQTGNYFSDFTQSNTTGSYINIRFTGTKVALYGKKKSDSGQATCTINGTNAATADFYAATETFMAKVWESPTLPYGTHTLKVEIAGTKNASSTGYRCRVDYVVVEANASGVYNDRTTGTGQNQFEYVGTWNVITGQADNYNQDFTESSTNGSYVNVRFTGTKIRVFGKKKPDSGMATCSIDGANSSTGDFYAATETKMALVWESPALSYGTHTLKVELAGQKNAASTGYLCRIDYVQVLTEIVAPSAMSYSATPVIYGTGIAITANTATLSGTAPFTFSVSPALPTGLSLNTTTGTITGTPTATAAAANYTVQATNSSGSTSAVVNIKVSTPITSVTLNPVADAYVYGGSTSSNYGTLDNLAIKGNSNAIYARKSFVKFDISNEGITSVTSAKLRLYAYRVDAAISVTASQTTDSWTETDITWTNAPATGTTISSLTMGSVQYYEWDVTSYITSQLSSGDYTISMVLNDLGNVNQFVYYNSREAANNLPQLVINGVMLKSAAPDAPHAIDGANFSLFPNPASNKVFINYSFSENADVQLEIYSLKGELMKVVNLVGQGNNQLQVDVSNLPAGIYIARMSSASFTKSSRLIIVR